MLTHISSLVYDPELLPVANLENEHAEPFHHHWH